MLHSNHKLVKNNILVLTHSNICTLLYNLAQLGYSNLTANVVSALIPKNIRWEFSQILCFVLFISLDTFSQTLLSRTLSYAIISLITKPKKLS